MEDKNKIIGIVAISVIFVLFVIVILIGLFVPVTPPKVTQTEIEKQRDLAIGGDVDAAAKLATMGKEACPAMLEVIEQVNLTDKQVEEEVKIACLQGIGANKYFESGLVIFKILDPGKDDDLVALRHQAYIATTRFMSDHFYKARAPYDERRDKVVEMKAEWIGAKKNREAKAAGGGGG